MYMFNIFKIDNITLGPDPEPNCFGSTPLDSGQVCRDIVYNNNPVVLCVVQGDPGAAAGEDVAGEGGSGPGVQHTGQENRGPQPPGRQQANYFASSRES